MDKKIFNDIPKFKSLSKLRLQARVILWVIFSVISSETLIVTLSYRIFRENALNIEEKLLLLLLFGLMLAAFAVLALKFLITWVSNHDNVTAMNRSEADLHTLTELHKAMKNNELSVYYQSQVDMQTGHIIGMEALIRWNHGTKGFISPAEFIPLAEESGLIGAIDNWVLESACTQNKQWYDQGHRLRIAVNLSAILFKDVDIFNTVAKILKKTQLPPAYLELEITETAIIKNVDAAIAVMHQLRTLGVTLSMDDFGTGYTSLSTLSKFPIQKLKIDKAFVHSISEYYNEPNIADSIIHLGQQLNLSILAEGIETEYQKNYFTNLHCNEGQGYYFSEPVPASKFVRLLRKEE